MTTVVINGLGWGDSFLILGLLDNNNNCTFDALRAKVQWNSMYHKGGAVPRLVSIQTTVAEKEVMIDGIAYNATIRPVYRHPIDVEPPVETFIPIVEELLSTCSDRLRKVLLAMGDTSNPMAVDDSLRFNHALIQYYRNGKDYISEHSDKTLDILRSSSICNVSLGCTRKMVLKSKVGPAGQEADNDSRDILEEVRVLVLPADTEAGQAVRCCSYRELEPGSDLQQSVLRAVSGTVRYHKLQLPDNSMFVLGKALPLAAAVAVSMTGVGCRVEVQCELHPPDPGGPQAGPG